MSRALNYYLRGSDCTFVVKCDLCGRELERYSFQRDGEYEFRVAYSYHMERLLPDVCEDCDRKRIEKGGEEK